MSVDIKRFVSELVKQDESVDISDVSCVMMRLESKEIRLRLRSACSRTSVPCLVLDYELLD